MLLDMLLDMPVISAISNQVSAEDAVLQFEFSHSLIQKRIPTESD